MDVGIISQIFAPRHGLGYELRHCSVTPGPVPGRDGLGCTVGHGLAGRPAGCSVRVPVPVGSLVELKALVSREVTVAEINSAFEAAASGPLRGVLVYPADPLVSSDITGDPASSVFDSRLTRMNGRPVTVVAWYDDEWGFANRVVDTSTLLCR